MDKLFHSKHLMLLLYPIQIPAPPSDIDQINEILDIFIHRSRSPHRPPRYLRTNQWI
jgi:hypothetical protein